MATDFHEPIGRVHEGHGITFRVSRKEGIAPELFRFFASTYTDAR